MVSHVEVGCGEPYVKNCHNQDFNEIHSDDYKNNTENGKSWETNNAQKMLEGDLVNLLSSFSTGSHSFWPIKKTSNSVANSTRIQSIVESHCDKINTWQEVMESCNKQKRRLKTIIKFTKKINVMNTANLIRNLKMDFVLIIVFSINNNVYCLCSTHQYFIIVMLRGFDRMKEFFFNNINMLIDEVARLTKKYFPKAMQTRFLEKYMEEFFKREYSIKNTINKKTNLSFRDRNIITKCAIFTQLNSISKYELYLVTYNDENQILSLTINIEYGKPRKTMKTQFPSNANQNSFQDVDKIVNDISHETVNTQEFKKPMPIYSVSSLNPENVNIFFLTTTNKRIFPSYQMHGKMKRFDEETRLLSKSSVLVQQPVGHLQVSCNLIDRRILAHMADEDVKMLINLTVTVIHLLIKERNVVTLPGKQLAIGNIAHRNRSEVNNTMMMSGHSFIQRKFSRCKFSRKEVTYLFIFVFKLNDICHFWLVYGIELGVSDGFAFAKSTQNTIRFLVVMTHQYVLFIDEKISGSVSITLLSCHSPLLFFSLSFEWSSLRRCHVIPSCSGETNDILNRTRKLMMLVFLHAIHQIEAKQVKRISLWPSYGRKKCINAIHASIFNTYPTSSCFTNQNDPVERTELRDCVDNATTASIKPHKEVDINEQLMNKHEEFEAVLHKDRESKEANAKRRQKKNGQARSTSQSSNCDLIYNSREPSGDESSPGVPSYNSNGSSAERSGSSPDRPGSRSSTCRSGSSGHDRLGHNSMGSPTSRPGSSGPDRPGNDSTGPPTSRFGSSGPDHRGTRSSTSRSGSSGPDHRGNDSTGPPASRSGSSGPDHPGTRSSISGSEAGSDYPGYDSTEHSTSSSGSGPGHPRYNSNWPPLSVDVEDVSEVNIDIHLDVVDHPEDRPEGCGNCPVQTSELMVPVEDR